MTSIRDREANQQNAKQCKQMCPGATVTSKRAEGYTQADDGSYTLFDVYSVFVVLRDPATGVTVSLCINDTSTDVTAACKSLKADFADQRRASKGRKKSWDRVNQS